MDASDLLPEGMTPEQHKRYMAAAHAVQTATKVEQEANGDTSDVHKHLRTGLNMCMAEHGALAHLLVSKGVITEQEYFDTIVKGAEQEAQRCAMLARQAAGLPDNVTFA